ncbi:MAG: hypothetical protein ACTHK2_10280 [Dokdonella sp.]|uniref:hypothetical protein n=1 Tax=Dokdonella sp. TaxID=2291710 RepID=UPI003F81608F
MSTRTEFRRAITLAALCSLDIAAADAPVAPAHLLEAPAALKAAFAAHIGHTVDVLSFNLGEHYAQVLVQNVAARDEFDEFAAVPGLPLEPGRPKKAGEIDCRRKVAFATLDLDAGVRALAQARAIAAANGYKTPDNVILGADIFCNDFGWRAILVSDTNDDAMLQVTWTPDGKSPKAQEMHEDGWRKVDVAKLLAGGAKVAAAAPKAAPKTVAGDGRTRDFLHGIDADLARVQAEVGAPLGFEHISLGHTQLSMDVFQPANRKRVSTWLVGEDGAIKLWREDDTIPFDCNKPFTTADFPLAQLADLIAAAPAQIPSMPQAEVKDAAVRRSGLCGRPHVYIRIEDERGYGNVEYDERGRLGSAEIQ